MTSATVNQFFVDVWLTEPPAAKVNQFFTDVWFNPPVVGNADGFATAVARAGDPPEQFIYRLQRPRYGLPRINWKDPSIAGLSYFRVLDNLNPSPLFSRTPQKLTPTDSSLFIVPGVDGNGLSANSTNQRLRDPANTFGMQGSEFTCMVYGVAYWSPTDSLSHLGVIIGATSGDSAPEFTLNKFTNNNWYAGFYTGTEFRLQPVATNTFTVGVPFVFGYRCKLGGEHAFWCAGKKVSTGTLSLGTTPNLAHDEFSIGGAVNTSGIGSAHSWARDSKSQLYWVALWDRWLRDDEFQRISAQPWCLLNRSPFIVRPRTPIGAGLAEGFATVVGSTIAQAVGHADGFATVVSNVSSGVGEADGIAQVEGISNVGSIGNADGIAQVHGVSNAPNTSGAGHAAGQAKVWANNPAIAITSQPILMMM